MEVTHRVRSPAQSRGRGSGGKGQAHQGQRGSQGMAVMMSAHTLPAAEPSFHQVRLGKRGFPMGNQVPVSLTETIFDKNGYLHQAECNQL